MRYALRTLAKSPAYAAVTILTLALGIGANTAIFSVVNGVLLKPLPYPRADRLQFISSTFPNLGFDRFWISVPEWSEFKERNRSFQAVGGYREGSVNLGLRSVLAASTARSSRRSCSTCSAWRHCAAACSPTPMPSSAPKT